MFKGSWEEDHRNEMSSSSQRFKAAWCQHAHCRGCWLWSPGWGGVCRSSLSPHSILCSLEEVSRCSRLVGGESTSFPWGSIFTSIDDNFPIQRPLSLFYLLIQSFICINTDSQIFILSFELLSNMLFLFCSHCSYLWLWVESILVASVVFDVAVLLFWAFPSSFPASKDAFQAPLPQAKNQTLLPGA